MALKVYEGQPAPTPEELESNGQTSTGDYRQATLEEKLDNPRHGDKTYVGFPAPPEPEVQDEGELDEELSDEELLNQTFGDGGVSNDADGDGDDDELEGEFGDDDEDEDEDEEYNGN